MKFKKRFLAFITTLAVVLHFIGVTAILAFAHDAMLDVNYDNCIGDTGDGIDEMWYLLENGSYGIHFEHETETITYRFVDDPEIGYSWTPSGKTSEVGDEIKDAYAASMQKWNNVYFYSYNADGTITKNKLINIVEITQGDANITIYPATIDELAGAAAQTSILGYVWLIEEKNKDNISISHFHAPTWRMDVNIDAFYEGSPLASLAGLSSTDIDLIKLRTGAHEIGHVLGLLDLDNENLCNADYSNNADGSSWHHHELLMGYGTPVDQRSANITYKDIAGVAITRGFHTNSDHKWLYAGLDTNGKYKLICSICNGVNAVDSLSGYTYDTYNACGGNHTLSSGNMMAVASYGTSDYYKCKYCRYVAPFSSIVSQNYSRTWYSSSLHKYVNNVNGLAYTYYESHDFVYSNATSNHHTNTCICGYQAEVPHSLTYQQSTDNCHTLVCECGYTREEDHLLTYQQSSDISHALICECGYTREETHSLAYQRASDEYHRLVCDCGYSYNEDHTLTYQDYHTDICVCGYTYTTPHNFTYQEGSDVNHHIATCECGYDDEVWHTWTYKSTSTSHHSCICPCGYVKIGEAHVFEQVGLRYSVCKFCGYTRDNTGPGGNVIMGEKTEEEKE